MQRLMRDQPSLCGRALLLHHKERGVERVAFASPAARRIGIRSGMTLAAAVALEGSVLRQPSIRAHDAEALRALGESLLKFGPMFQSDGVEGLWLDASAAHLWGSEMAWAQAVGTACEGLQFRFVVGSERFTTQALAKSRVQGAVVGPRGDGRLAAVSLEALEEGWLGAQEAQPFRALGLSTLGELAGLSPGALVSRFGTIGRLASRLARGEDESLLVADPLPATLEETVQLDWPAEQLEPVLFALKRAVDRISGRLQGRQQAAVRLRITLMLDAAEAVRVRLLLSRPMSERRLLLELLRHRLTDLTVEHPIVAITLKVEEHCPAPAHQRTFGEREDGGAALDVVLSRLQSTLGEEALFTAQPQPRHRPEASWSKARFSPPEAGPAASFEMDFKKSKAAKPAASWPRRKSKGEVAPTLDDETMGTRPSRLFQAPCFINSQMDAAGALVAMDVAGRRRRVEAIQGPERVTGEWWSRGYARDYYRVQLEGVGSVWVFRDGRDGLFYAQGVFD